MVVALIDVAASLETGELRCAVASPSVELGRGRTTAACSAALPHLPEDPQRDLRNQRNQ